MTNPLEELKEKYWLNVYHSENPNAPICNLVLVSKDNKEEKYKYPIWKDKEKDGYGYVGKLDTYEGGNSQAPVEEDLSDEVPFN